MRKITLEVDDEVVEVLGGKERVKDICFEHIEYVYSNIREEPDESMDGDHASALASAGWGTDEDYNPGDML